MGKQKSKRLVQTFNAPNISTRGTFNFSKRHLAVVIPLLIALETGKSFAADCALDGATVRTSVSNSVLCDNNGTLIINASGGSLLNATTGILNNNSTLINNRNLTNDGLINNIGTLMSAGQINGNGTLNNTGTLTVLSGGKVDITNSDNLSGGTLTGGSWVVDSSSSKDGSASLVIGSGTWWQIMMQPATLM